MDLEEQQGFTQDKFAALDVSEVEEQATEVAEEKEENTQDFGKDNK
jgi:hypothetical protein